MRLSYKEKVFAYFALIFIAFSSLAVGIEQYRQSRLKRTALEAQLSVYIDMIERGAINNLGYNPVALDTLIALFPRPIRISLLDAKGHVLYDNSVAALYHLDNHANRPEIQQAESLREGSDIRLSDTHGTEYLYLARRLPQYYVRVALPYDRTIKAELRADNVFIYWISAWLLVMLGVVFRVSNHLGEAIRRLRDLALSHRSDVELTFTDDELGDISREIVRSYTTLQDQATKIAQERGRLMQHILNLSEGIAFFNPAGQIEFFNAPFLQFLNSISSSVGASPLELLEDNAFRHAMQSLRCAHAGNYEERIKRHNRCYILRVTRFEDGGAEMLLADVSERERIAELKREMTSNISHELRTPVTSIRGYLETCLETEDLPNTVQKRFVEQAYRQTLILSELIRDIGLLTKLDEASEQFDITELQLENIRSQLLEEFTEWLQKQRITLEWSIPKKLTIRGNKNLIYSIFRNLVENAVRYAGTDIKLGIQLYREDERFYYFTVYDTGRGIPEKHLGRIFERFYRCCEGRTRDTGGTGLGLSIVKNAVLFHQGDISAKGRTGGGFEVLFRLAKL